MKKPDFGLDAPKIVRNLFIASSFAFTLLILVVVLFHNDSVLSEVIAILIELSFVSLIVPPILMILSSKFFKVRNRDKMIELLNISNAANVLDIGCGRGLYTVGIASKLTTGKVYGIDIWNQEDISGNSESSITKNMRISGLSDKILLMTEDMREMHFTDDFFDLVVASFSIHNIYGKVDRRKALSEIYRVTKKSGKIIITDFRNINEYISYFTANNCELKLNRIAAGVFPISRNLIFQKGNPS